MLLLTNIQVQVLQIKKAVDALPEVQNMLGKAIYHMVSNIVITTDETIKRLKKCVCQ